MRGILHPLKAGIAASGLLLGMAFGQAQAEEPDPLGAGVVMNPQTLATNLFRLDPAKWDDKLKERLKGIESTQPGILRQVSNYLPNAKTMELLRRQDALDQAYGQEESAARNNPRALTRIIPVHDHNPMYGPYIQKIRAGYDPATAKIMMSADMDAQVQQEICFLNELAPDPKFPKSCQQLAPQQ
jgi:hypothetical protein